MSKETYIDGTDMAEIIELAKQRDTMVDQLFATMCGVDKMPEDENEAEALFEKTIGKLMPGLLPKGEDH